MRANFSDLFTSLEQITEIITSGGRRFEALMIAGRSISADSLRLFKVESSPKGSYSIEPVCEWRSEASEVIRVGNGRVESGEIYNLKKTIEARLPGNTSEITENSMTIDYSAGQCRLILVCGADSKSREWKEEEKRFLKLVLCSILLEARGRITEDHHEDCELALQERLLRSDELLKNFEGNVLDILAVADQRLIFKYVSPSVLSTMEYSPEELLGTNALNLVEKNDVERVIAESKALFREKRHGSFRYRARTKSGQVIWMETAVSPLFEGENIAGWTMSSREVTDEMKLQAELKARDSMMLFMNDLYVLVLSGDNLQEAASKIANRAYEEKGVVGCRITFSEEEPFDLEVSRGDTELFPTNVRTDERVLGKLISNHIFVDNLIVEGKESRYVCIALESNDEIVGTFESLTERVTGLTEESIDLYRLVGTTISLSLSKIKNLVITKRNHITSESLRKATEAITRDLNMRTVIESIVEGLRQVIPFYSAAVELVDGDELLIVGGSWPGRDCFVGTRFTMEEGSPGFDVVKNKLIVLAADAQKKYPQFNKPDFFFIKSWMGVPLIIEDEPIGMIAVDSEEAEAFKIRHLEALKAFADIAAIGINNARLHEEVRELSIRDYLTGIYNRRGLFELGEREIEKSKRYGTDMGLIMFDIDNFKKLNDNLGHLAGDFVLKRVAQICNRILRAADIFGRYGGDEFIVLLPMTDAQRTEEAALRICHSLEESEIVFNGTPIDVKASLGTASLEGHENELEDMIKRADRNLYTSKGRGGNRVTGGPSNG